MNVFVKTNKQEKKDKNKQSYFKAVWSKKCKHETKSDLCIQNMQRSPKPLEILDFLDPIFMFKNMHFIFTLGDIFWTT